MKYPTYASRAVVNWFERHLLGLLRVVYHPRGGDVVTSLTLDVESVPFLELDSEQLYVAQRTALALCMAIDHFDGWACGHYPLGYIYPVYRADVQYTYPDDPVFGFKVERGRYASVVRDLANPQNSWNFNSYPATLFSLKSTPAPSDILSEISAHVDAQDIHRAIGRYVDMSQIEILPQRVDAITLHNQDLRKASRVVFTKYLHTFVGTPFINWQQPQYQHRLFPGLQNIWNQVCASDAAILGPVEFYYLKRLSYAMLLSTLLVESWKNKTLPEGFLPPPDSMVWGYRTGDIRYEWHSTGIPHADGVNDAHPLFFQVEEANRKASWDKAANDVATVIERIQNCRKSGVEDRMAEKRLGEEQFNWYLYRLNEMIPKYAPMPTTTKITELRMNSRWQKQQQRKKRSS